jgi:glycosyltransferase 2 family protein
MIRSHLMTADGPVAPDLTGLLRSGTFRRAATWAVTALVLAAAIWLIDWRVLAENSARLSAGALLACIVLCVGTHLLLALRWTLIATVTVPARYLPELLVALHYSLFNLVTPGAIGSDAVRIVGGKSRAGGRVGSAGFVLLERLLGLLAQCLVFLVAFTLVWWRQDAPMPAAGLAAVLVLVPAAAAITAVLAGVALISVPPVLPGWTGIAGRIAHFAHNLLQGLQTSLNVVAGTTSADRRQVFARLALLLAISIAGVLSWAVAVVPLARAIGLDLGFPVLAMIVVMTELARLLPVSPQGIGVREAVFALLAAQFGASAAAGFTVCALLYTLNAVVIGGVGLAAGLAVGRRG